MIQPPAYAKRCMRCGAKKPLREYRTPRQRVCLACRALDPSVDLQGTTAYQRTRYRVRVVRRSLRTGAQPRIGVSDLRKCRHCHEVKPVSAFAGPRWRLCLACENPP
jgi:hypothetical protein